MQKHIFSTDVWHVVVSSGLHCLVVWMSISLTECIIAACCNSNTVIVVIGRKAVLKLRIGVLPRKRKQVHFLCKQILIVID